MLKRLTLDNFKSFRSAEIPLGPLTLIVGATASGKSNIRDALRVLHGVGLGYSLAEILGEKYGPGGILQWRGIRGGAREVAFQGSATFRLEVELDDSVPSWCREYALTVAVPDPGHGPQVAAERLGTERNGFHASPAGDPLERGGELCSDVSKALGSLRFLDLDPDAMRQPSRPGQHILGDRGENLSSVLQAMCEEPLRKETLLGWVRALTPMDVVDFEFVADIGGRVLVHLVESHGHRVSALSASDGTLRFLALVAALLGPDTGRIFFVEELGNGLPPTHLHLLLHLLQKVCRDEHVQVIGTTHNPALLALLDQQTRQDALLVYRAAGAPDSRVRPISDLPDIESVLDKQDLGGLHASGWLEDAAVFSEPDEEDAEDTKEGEGDA